jgi:two-component system KDP operon response regulator KdpE
MRRTQHDDEEVPIITEDFIIDFAERRVERPDGSEVQLSPIEWKLIESLAHRAGHLVTREALLEATWGPDAVDKAQYLRVYMASIRRKLEPDRSRPRYFVTAPGLGLRFDPSPAAAGVVRSADSNRCESG